MGDVGDVRQHPAAIGAGDQGDRLHQGDQGLDSTGDGRVGDVGDVRQHRAAIGTAGDQGLDSTTGDGAGPRGRGAWSIGTATSSTAPATAAWAT